MIGSQKSTLLCVSIPCTSSIGAIRTVLGSNGLLRDKGISDDRGGVDIVGAIRGDFRLGTELVKEVGADLGSKFTEGGIRSALVLACWSVEVDEDACFERDMASGAPMHSNVHAGATLDRVAAAVAPGVTNSGSWS
jgi:hypothetical protein